MSDGGAPDAGTGGTSAADGGTAGTSAADGGTAGTSAADGGTAGTSAADGGTAGTSAADGGVGGTVAPTGGTGTGGTDAGAGGAGGDNDAGAGGSGENECPVLGDETCVGGPPEPACLDGDPVEGQPDLIDDFEDQNACLRFVDCRRGFWFGFDNWGWHLPGLLLDSEHGSRVLTASGEITASGDYWGIALWPSATNYCNERAVDLSEYAGIAFSAKNVTGAAVRLTVRDDATHSGASDEGETSPKTTLALTTAWASYEVRWSELLRPSDASLADPSSIRIIKWEGDEVNASYELLLDDIVLFKN
jgi:hypothetical protein